MFHNNYIIVCSIERCYHNNIITVDIPSDDNSLIEWIFDKANPADEYIIQSYDNQWLSRKDFECLRPKGWLTERASVYEILV